MRRTAKLPSTDQLLRRAIALTEDARHYLAHFQTRMERLQLRQNESQQRRDDSWILHSSRDGEPASLKLPAFTGRFSRDSI